MRMADLVIEDLIQWLRKNGDFLVPNSNGKTLADLAQPLEWEEYVNLIENGIPMGSEEMDAEALRTSSEEFLQKRRFADFFVLIAFAQVYSITIICVTDAEIEEKDGTSPSLSNPEWGPFVYSIEPTGGNESSRIAVLGITTNGKTINPLLPQHYWESLQRTLILKE